MKLKLCLIVLISLSISVPTFANSQNLREAIAKLDQAQMSLDRSQNTINQAQAQLNQSQNSINVARELILHEMRAPKAGWVCQYTGYETRLQGVTGKGSTSSEAITNFLNQCKDLGNTTHNCNYSRRDLQCRDLSQ